jgi:hypothetical protein
MPPEVAAREVHCLLGPTIEKLAAIEQRRKDGSQDLELGIEALAAVIELIQADVRNIKANTAGPLKRLMAALHDLQYGAKSAMISDRLDQGPPRRGKPTNTISDSLRGQFAAAVDILIESGVSRQDAGDYVARRIIKSRIPIKGLRREPGVTAARVLRWRDEAGVASSQAFNESFKQIKDWVRNRLGSDIKRSEAESVVTEAIDSAARWTARSA